MRIAYLTARLPYPPIGGDRARSYHMLRHLLRKHRVTLYAIASPLPKAEGTRPEELAGVEEKHFRISRLGYAWNALKGLFSKLPMQVKLYENHELRKALAADLEQGEIDLLFVHLVRMAEYARPFSRLPRILDMTDSIHLNYSRMPPGISSPLRLAARVERPRLGHYEALAPGWFDKVLLASPVDLEWVRQRSGCTNLVCVPQGTDLEKFSFSTARPRQNQVVFFGKLDSLPNADAAKYFAREVFPRVRRSIPNAEFLVVGWNPPLSVRNLARLPGITVRGNVAEVQPHVAQSAVSVAPTRFGAGIQNKIIESLALGVPAVASPEAALPFGEMDQGPILVGRTVEELAEHVVHVLSDDVLRERLRRLGRLLVESKYTWERVLAPLDNVLEQLRSRGAET
jgi:sugar transferase (PEP-CTERM/EpsH1 system associated)